MYLVLARKIGSKATEIHLASGHDDRPYSCIFEFKFICNLIIITSDDVYCNIRNVKFIKVMHFKQMIVTAVCVLFLLKV